MNLTQIVTNAAAGFAMGFALGRSNLKLARNCPTERDLDVAEAYLTEKEKEEKKDVVKSISVTKDLYKKSLMVAPYLVSWAYSNITPIINDSSLGSNFLITIPSAYLGCIAGRAMKKAKERPLLEEVVIARNIRENPDKALDYVPQNLRDAIKDSLETVERKTLTEPLDMEILSDLDHPKNPLKNIYEILSKTDKAYTKALTKWGINAHMETILRAKIQRDATKFFEGEGNLGIQVRGNLDKMAEARIYEIDGQNYTTYRIDFSGLKIAVKDQPNGPSIGIISNPGKVEKLTERPWNNDYKTVAGEIRQYHEEGPVILIKTTPGMPNFFRSVMATDAIVNAMHNRSTEYSETDQINN